MSVTFYLGSNETYFPACDTCGQTAVSAGGEPCDAEGCLGYGPDAVRSTPELNVANANAAVILRTLLGYEDADLYGGELDAPDLKLRLSMAPYRQDGAVRPTVQYAPNVVSFGLCAERIERYVAALSELAELADRRGEPVLYG